MSLCFSASADSSLASLSLPHKESRNVETYAFKMSTGIEGLSMENVVFHSQKNGSLFMSLSISASKGKMQSYLFPRILTVNSRFFDAWIKLGTILRNRNWLRSIKIFISGINAICTSNYFIYVQELDQFSTDFTNILINFSLNILLRIFEEYRSHIHSASFE